MFSLKHRIFVLLLGSLVLLSASFLVILGFYMKERDVAAAIVKVQTDLATCSEIINQKFPGSWSEQNGNLYKGTNKISLNNELVDYLSDLTGDTVTLFLGDTRVATTVRGSNGERAIGTRVSTTVAQKVLQDGQTYVGQANVVGEWYQTGYVPLRAESGKIIGIFYVGISRTYEHEIITRSLVTMAGIGLSLTIAVALLTMFFLQRVIIFPLQNIVAGTRDVAAGNLTQKVKVSGAKEIGELEDAFNQMLEQIQSLTEEINRANSDDHRNGPTINYNDLPIEQTKCSPELTELTTDNTTVPEPKQLSRIDNAGCIGVEGLPKGLNQATLGQIVQFLQVTRRPLSAEEVAEGVKLTRVTVRRYLEFLENRGFLKSEQKYGTVGRPVKLFIQF